VAGGEDLAGGLDTVSAGHLEIHQHHVGTQGCSGVYRLVAVRGFADELQLVGVGDEAAQAVPEQRVESAPDGYTPRERQVLALPAEAATTGQIADRLGIAQKTVRNLLSTLYLKLGIEDRGQAVLAARRLLGK